MRHVQTKISIRHTRDNKGGHRRIMLLAKIPNENRQHKRVPVDFPVTFNIRRASVLGKAVNANNRGMLIESNMPLSVARQILGILARKRKNSLKIEFTYKKKECSTEGEMKHFHMDFSGTEPFRALAGFLMPRLEEVLSKGS